MTGRKENARFGRSLGDRRHRHEVLAYRHPGAGAWRTDLAVRAFVALLVGIAMVASAPDSVRAQQMGRTSVDQRAKQAGDQDAETRQSAARLANDPRGAEQGAAIRTLIDRLGDKGANAARSSTLTDILQNPESTSAAVPVLIEMLHDEDQGVSAAAADALAELGVAATPAVPVLKQITSSQRAGLRETAAARALARIGAAVERARYQVRYEEDLLTVEADQARLEDLMKEISQQAHIAVVLANGIGAQRVSAAFAKRSLAEGLHLILADYDAFTYSRGGRGLLTVWIYGKLEGRGLQPIPFKEWASTADLEERLRDYDPEVRAEALESLVDRGRTSAAQQVIDALDDADERVRMTALQKALSEDIELPPEKLSQLALNDGWHVIRFLALKGLTAGPIEEWATDAEWVAGAMLSDPNPSISRYAEVVLDRLNPPEPTTDVGQPPQNSRPPAKQRR